MAKRPTLSREPQTINEDLWYYEFPEWIIVVSWETVGTTHRSVKIPWSLLRASVRRKNAVDRYRKLQRAKKAAK